MVFGSKKVDTTLQAFPAYVLNRNKEINGGEDRWHRLTLNDCKRDRGTGS